MKEKKKIFSLAIKIALRREYFGGLLFMPTTGEIIQLNRAAFELLKQIVKYGSLRVAFMDLVFWEKLQTREIVKEVSSNV